MYFFNNDYSEGAAPEVYRRLQEENLVPSPGYGMDLHSEQAAALIRREIQNQDADIHFLIGGTQANVVLISSVLKPYQAVIAAASGHINVHETGAVEATGHKVLVAESRDGKILPESIREVVRAHADEHMVQPRLVYVSQSTELGTVYRKAELEAIRAVCDELGLWLYVDGARLGSALGSSVCDHTMADLARLSDAFTIGGTKNGLLFGEALVLMNPGFRPDFRFSIKHRGAMLAKGFLTGIQFAALFEDGLFFRLADHANRQARKLAAAFREAGYPFLAPAESNQLFPILPDSVIERLEENFLFQFQTRTDENHRAMRFVTSWATPDEAVDALIAALKD